MAHPTQRLEIMAGAIVSVTLIIFAVSGCALENEMMQLAPTADGGSPRLEGEAMTMSQKVDVHCARIQQLRLVVSDTGGAGVTTAAVPEGFSSVAAYQKHVTACNALQVSQASGLKRK